MSVLKDTPLSSPLPDRDGVPGLESCEEVVRGWGDGARKTPTM